MDNYFNASSGAAALNFLGGIGTSLVNFGFNSYLNDVNWLKRQALYVQQHRDAINDWNMVNEYNSPAADRARREAAGYNALDEMSIAPAQQINQNDPSGMQPIPASFSNPVADAIQGALASKQLQLLDAQAEDLKASADKKKAETDYQQIMTDIAEQTKEFKIEGEKLSNDLTKKQSNEIDEKIKLIKQSIKESVAREESEWVKQSLMQSEDQLNQVKAYNLVAMLPYEQALASAKSDHEKAAASLCWAQAAIQEGLMKEGYAHQIVEELKSRINLNEVGITGKELDNAATDLTNKIKNGEPNDLAVWFNRHPWVKASMPAVAFLSGDLFKVANTVQTSAGSIIGPVLGFGAAGLVGAKSVRPAESPISRVSPRSVSILTDINGRPLQ